MTRRIVASRHGILSIAFDIARAEAEGGGAAPGHRPAPRPAGRRTGRSGKDGDDV